jgi:hypothetical protein
MSNEELERKERERREKKLYKQLDKQQKKLASKGIHVDMDSLRKDYETQRAGGKSTLNLEAALAAANMGSEDIDVVGGLDDSIDSSSDNEQTTLLKLPDLVDIKRKISPFSIESLLAKRQLSVQAAAAVAAASIKQEEENNNPPMGSPIPTSCSSPLSRGSMASPPPSSRYFSPSPSHTTPSAPPSLHFPIPMPHPGLSHELSLLKPLTACPEKGPFFPASFFNKFDPAKISFASSIASLQPPRTSSPIMAFSPDNNPTTTFHPSSLTASEAPPVIIPMSTTSS